MKILHILTDSGIGGAGILLENLLLFTALPRSCFTVVLPRGAALAPRLQARGFRVLPILHGADRSRAPRDFWPLVGLLRREKPDILHTHASLTGRAAGYLAGVPIRLATRHCAYPPGRAGQMPALWLHRLADRHLSTCTVATAVAAAENLVKLGIPPEKIVTIRNGARAVNRFPPRLRADGRRALGIGERDFVVGCCGRLVKDKDIPTLLRAAGRLLPKEPRMRFLLIGGGAEEENLRRAAASRAFGERVLFTGHVSDPTPYLNLLDVAVNCSAGTETSCLALSEAMSLGLPCVASRYGGNPELVREGENGLLFDVGDDEELANCLLRLLYDTSLYDRLAAGAHARYRHDLRAEQMARAYDNLYLALYEAPRPHGELLSPPYAVWQHFSPFPAKR